ncbi:MAG TPA: hypothetical protein DC063_03805 [Arenimonas sp.]|nr:hypothetical protein [Arenimonas sp.]
MNTSTLHPLMAAPMAKALGRVMAQLNVPRDELPAALAAYVPDSWSSVSTTLGEAQALECVLDAYDVARLISDCGAPGAPTRAPDEASPSQPLPWWRLNGEGGPA